MPNDGKYEEIRLSLPEFGIDAMIPEGSFTRQLAFDWLKGAKERQGVIGQGCPDSLKTDW